MDRVILVSNRLPVTVRKKGDTQSVVRSGGGLVAGLGPVHDSGNSAWVGSTEAVTPGDGLDESLRQQRLINVPVDPRDARGHYEGFSNQVLWPLFHYLLARVGFDSRDYDAYRRVNEQFADAIVAHAQPTDVIWVHDYQLMLLPEMLRQRLPEATIGFFLHIPFPSSEVFRILPHKEEILRGLMGANLIGVHTYDYARHLVSSLRRILGVEFDDDWVRMSDGQCRIGVFPLGVDVYGLRKQAGAVEVTRRAAEMRQHVLGGKVILGVDRMDYTKGLPLRLQAFKRLLKRYPEWRGQVVLMQLAVPSRSSIHSYQELKEEVDRLVGDVNGKYGADGMVPIHYMYRSVPPEELAVLYRLADVAFVTPIRDGMNLVAKEYVASRADNTGVLVLSEFAGAASEMGEAILVNPWDIDGTAEALHQALSMEPQEMMDRMQALGRRVAANHVGRWAERFLKKLRSFAASPASDGDCPGEGGSVGWKDQLAEEFASAERSLLALDYDGTMVDIVQTPDLAAPTDELLALLARLASQPGVEVVVISGRDPGTLERWFGGVPVGLVAEHGVHRRWRGLDQWDQSVHGADLSWKAPVRAILEDYTARSPGSFIEEKPVSLVWHYRKVAPGFGVWQARELAQHLSEAFANSPLAVLHGAKVVEVRPQGIDKGRALSAVLDRLGPFGFVLVAGDDRTDEDMFGAAELDPTQAWTIKVGPGPTHASRRLPTPAKLRALLERACQRRDGR